MASKKSTGELSPTKKTKKELYDDYLKSPEWKALSARARERDGHKCVFCYGKPDHVHHVRYPKHFDDDELASLITVCSSCHDKCHAIGTNPKQDNEKISKGETEFKILEFYFKNNFDKRVEMSIEDKYKATSTVYLSYATGFVKHWSKHNYEERPKEVLKVLEILIREAKELVEGFKQ